MYHAILLLFYLHDSILIFTYYLYAILFLYTHESTDKFIFC
jgi:hypothetical protein